MDTVTTKEKFKAILKLKGIDHKRLAKIMGMSPEYTKILLSRSSLCPSYMKLVVHIFEKSLDH